MRIEYPPGATPLEPEALEPLIPTLSTQEQLDEFEAQNIASAELWARGNSRLRSILLSQPGLFELHRRMFDQTWKWAGQYRNRETNIGVSPALVREQVPALSGDARHWIENETWPLPEIAVRVHHRLVYIHPFVNGNGRHARFVANLLLEFNGLPRLPWGGGGLVGRSDRRDEYIASLREADREEYGRLVAFAQSRS